MSKSWKLILLGLIPLAVGYIMNYTLLQLPIPGVLLYVIEIGLLFLWGYLAYRVSAHDKNPVLQAFLMNSFGLLMLVLILYQELILGHFWHGMVGHATQIYFLPLLSLVARIMVFAIRAMAPIRIWPFCVVIWISMFAVCYVGCVKKQKFI